MIAEIALALLDTLSSLGALAASSVPQLMLALVACGAVLFVSTGTVLDGAVYAAQRLIVIVLTVPLVGTVPSAIGLTSWLATAVMMVSSVRPSLSNPGWQLAPGISFRAFAAGLAIVATQVLVRNIQQYAVPPDVWWIICWLMVSGGCLWSIWRRPLHAGWYAVTLSDAGRLLYALGKVDASLWGLWYISDVVVVWAALYLNQPWEPGELDVPQDGVL